MAGPTTTPKTKPKDDAPPARRWRIEPLSDRLRTLLKSPLGKRGFAAVEIVTHWPLIVGERLAEVTLPERLVLPRGERTGGTLEVRVDGPLALEVQHLEPQIIEQVNSFCGFQAVARLKLARGRVPPRVQRRPPPPPLDPETRSEIERMVATIENQDLKAALARLGESVHRDARGKS